MIEPIDTSTLGPVRFEPDAERRQAQVVRDALGVIAMDCEKADLLTGARAATVLASLNNDAILAKLQRLLK